MGLGDRGLGGACRAQPVRDVAGLLGSTIAFQSVLSSRERWYPGKLTGARCLSCYMNGLPPSRVWSRRSASTFSSLSPARAKTVASTIMATLASCLI